MTMSVDATSVNEAVVIMTRIFDAPREKVWEALTRPEHVAKWFAGHGFTNPVCEMDVRPGGLWKQVMRSPDGREFAMEFIYVEVVKPLRLVWKDANFGKATGGPPTRENTVTLEDLGQKTKWTLVARFGSIAERDISRDMGFSDMITQGCEKLNALVVTL